MSFIRWIFGILLLGNLTYSSEEEGGTTRAPRCCPVDCSIGQWSTWSVCNAVCERTGQQRRTRSLSPPRCNGKACPSGIETKTCNGPCCKRDCLFTNWSSWGKCVAPSGACSTNSGTEERTRRITRPFSCGGTCGNTRESRRCTPLPIACKLAIWGAWGSCQLDSGRTCGSGNKRRQRSILQQPSCSPSCEKLTNSSSCIHSCCPVSCVYSVWGAWSDCSTQCGSGMKQRTRQIRTQSECNGSPCKQDQLKETKVCSKYVNVNCVMSTWSSWSACSTGCGTGTNSRSRSVVQRSKCRGTKCGALLDVKSCVSYRDRTNCQVTSWSAWGPCSDQCSVGIMKRIRAITVRSRCNGRLCPNLEDTAACGKKNGGCEQSCLAGVCGCHAGFIKKNVTHCVGKNCGRKIFNYCPVVMRNSLASTKGACKEVIVQCPGGSFMFPVTCQLSCSPGYTLKGSSSISCQTSGSWSSHQTTYCDRNNKPPTNILLSPNTVKENEAAGFVVGVLTTADVNKNDVHTYRIVDDSCNCFLISNDKLKTRRVFDYENMPNRYVVTIDSTDNGLQQLSVNKTFQISISDVNEKPTDIILSRSFLNENADENTFVGSLQTVDDDNNQTYIYQLLDAANGLFKLDGNRLMTARKNDGCISKKLPYKCPLNFEQKSSYEVFISSVDNGNPTQSVAKKFDIRLIDINDPPYNITLSNNRVKENAVKGTLIGTFSTSEEDRTQLITYTLLNNDNGNFYVSVDGKLYKNKPSDYETTKNHQIIVEATDNGSEKLKTSQVFTINVIDVNEPPVSLNFIPLSLSVSITNQTITIQENVTINTKLGTFELYDKDSIQKVIMKINDDSGTFALDTSSVTCRSSSVNHSKSKCVVNILLTTSLNYETAQSYVISLKVIDRGHSVTYDYKFVILDCNDRPTGILINNGHNTSVYENTKGVFIGSLTTEDEDIGQSYNYKIIDDYNLFELSLDSIKFKDNAFANYEAKSSYLLQIQSSDNGDPVKTFTDTITINIIDLNDAPTNVTLSKSNVYENSTIGNTVGKLIVTDEDVSLTQHSFDLSNTTNFIIKNGFLQVNAKLDFESENIIYVAVTCTDIDIVTQWVLMVSILDVNEAPTAIDLSNMQLPENTSPPFKISDLRTSDPDNKNSPNQGFHYTILTHKHLLEVRGDSLYAKAQFDYETTNTIDVEIMTTDSGNPPLSFKELKTIKILDRNDLPTDIVLSNNVVYENSGLGVVIGRFQTIDEDLNQDHKYTLLDSSNGRFLINGNNLEIAKNNTACIQHGGLRCELNYEESSLLFILIKATDDGAPELSVSKNISIYISDLNDKPRHISISNFTIAEHAPVDYIIGKLKAIDEDKNQIIQFSIIGKYQSLFYINDQSNLCKKTNDSLPAKTSFVLRIQAVDNGAPVMKTESDIIIEVLDVNESPFKTIITHEGAQQFFNESKPRISENLPAGTVVGTIYSYEKDSSARLSFKLDDTSNYMFELDSNISCKSHTGDIKTKCQVKLLTKKILNYEDKPSHSIIIRTTDQAGLSHVQKFLIKVVDLNDSPTDILLSGKKTASFAENTIGTFVADLSTIDEDKGQKYTYEIIGNGKNTFKILQHKLFLKSDYQADYERNSSYIVTLKSTDDGFPAKFVIVNQTIYVEDLNEKPVDMELSSSTIYENTNIGTIVGEILIDDPDNFGNDNAKQTHKCTITKEGPITFFINQLTGNAGKQIYLVVVSAVDYESDPEGNVTITCYDSGKPSLHITKEFTVKVIDENEPPVSITLSNSDIMENSIDIIGILSTVDPDNSAGVSNQTFSYKLLNTTLPFKIDGYLLKPTRTLDYEVEKGFSLYIQSTDSGNPKLSVVTAVSVVVIDINEPPLAILLSNTTVQENAAKGTVVGILSVIDNDLKADGSKQQHSYDLITNPLGIFRIAGSQLQIAEDNTMCLQLGGTHCKLNFEQNRFMHVMVRATDDGQHPQSLDYNFMVNVLNINEKPRNLQLSSNIVPENASLGYAIGQFTVIDEDYGQIHTFTFVDDDNGRFYINKNNSLIKAKKTNYESQKTHKIVVAVTDNGLPAKTINKEFQIVVQNVNESPTNLRLTSLNASESFHDNQPCIKENQPVNTIVATIEAEDQDVVQNLRFDLLENMGKKFSIASDVFCENITLSNVVTHTRCRVNLIVNKILNYEEQSIFLISIRVTDHAGLSHTASFNITVLDSNDPPTNITVEGEHLVFVKENLRYKRIGLLETIDEDTNSQFLYQLVDDGGHHFTLHKTLFNAYELQTSGIVLDYESQSSYSVIIKSTDNGKPALSVLQRITVQVLDVNETPKDIVLTNNHVKENTAIGLPVGNVTVIDPDNSQMNRQTHSCTMVQNTDHKYILSNGVLSVNSMLNYEASAQDFVRILCEDSGFPRKSLEKMLTIFIEDVNENPTSISLTTSGNVPENINDYFVGEFVAVDPDDSLQQLNFSFIGTIDTSFKLVGNTLRTAKMLNYELQKSHVLFVKVGDKGGLTHVERFTITVEDRNDRPSEIVCNDPLSLAENENVGKLVGICFAVDEDRFQHHGYKITHVYAFGYGGIMKKLSSASSAFTIHSTTGEVQLNMKLDYEQYWKYSLTVQTKDSGQPSLSFQKNITVLVTNVNQKPTDILLSNTLVKENSGVGTIVGNLHIVDPDNKNVVSQTHTCLLTCVMTSIVCPFQIDQHDQVIVRNSTGLNYEDKQLFDVTIECDEDEDFGFMITKNFTIQVLNINEPPQQINLSPSLIDEHNKIGATVGVIEFVDPDNLNSLVDTVNVESFETFGAPFKLVAPFSLVATKTLDYEKKSIYVVQVTLRDNGTPPQSATENITIHVHNLNDDPTDIMISPSSLHEDMEPFINVSTLTTLDPDYEQNHTYRLLDDAGLFKIYKDQLILIGFLDYEAFQSVDIYVETTDDGNPPLSFKKKITIPIIDINDKPSRIDVTIMPVPENTKKEVKIADLHIVDDDKYQTHMCECISYKKDFVRTVTETNGNVSLFLLADKYSIDYEAESQLFFEIRCSDNGKPKLWIEASFYVPVIDLNEAPTGIFIRNSSLVYLDENPIPGEVVGSLKCSDPDQGQMFTYEVLGEAKKLFNVTASELIVNDLVNFNFEAPPGVNQYNISIKVTDNAQPPLSYSGYISIVAKDVNEPPSNVSLIHGSLDVNESTAVNTILGQLWAENPEGFRQKITYKLLNYKDMFRIVTTHAPFSSSFLTLIDELHYDIQSSYSVSIEAADNGAPSLSVLGVINFNVKKSTPCVDLNILCQQNSVCERINKTDGACTCSEGFELKGVDCVGIDDCNSCSYCESEQQKKCEKSLIGGCSPCQNNGTCFDAHLNYTCQCVQGFSGHDCSTNIDDCSPNPCHNSTCYDLLNDYTCTCDHGFYGRNCSMDVDECTSNPCFRSTKCIDLRNGYKCECMPGYTGLSCERRLSDCSNGKHCSENHVCTPGNLKRKNNTHPLCVPIEHITTLYFPASFAQLEENSGALWKLQFQLLLMDNVSVPFSWVSNKEKLSFKLVQLTDVIILSYKQATSNYTNSVPGYNQLNTGKGNKDEQRTEVRFFGAYNDVTLARNALLYSINETCEELFTDCTIRNHLFACNVCSIVSEYLRDSSLKPPVMKYTNNEKEESPLMSILPFAAGGLGLLLLVVLITLIYRSRRNARKCQEDNKGKCHVDNGVMNLDIITRRSQSMLNHDLNNFDGLDNPMYGMNEDEVDNKEFDNPLYEACNANEVFGDSTDMKKKPNTFENPLYGVPTTSQYTESNFAENSHGIINPFFVDVGLKNDDTDC